MARLRDLIVLVADADIAAMLGRILRRPAALDIREIRFELRRHEDRDPGCFRTPHELLRAELDSSERAMVVFDHCGSGQEHLSRSEVERAVEDRLTRSGWTDRNAAIAIAPEVEAWLWNTSPHLEEILHWPPATTELPLADWIEKRGMLDASTAKPVDPKAALDLARRVCRMPRTTPIYEQVAERASLKRCQDPAFTKLRETLRRWFPA
jgi:hypothetical protein